MLTGLEFVNYSINDFDIKDIDLVVNDTYSELHYPITLDLLEHGFNVLVEKPFGRTRLECETLIKTANEKGVVLAVFQQTFYAPFYQFAKEVEKASSNDSSRLARFIKTYVE